MIQFKNLCTTPLEEIVRVFNLAFSDYFVPIKTSEEALQRKFLVEKVRLDVSVGAFENDQLVGFVLHFGTIVNGEKILYNGGTGVIPSHRGQNLTCRMITHCLPLIKTEGFSKIKLEVFAINSFALKAYQKMGFKEIRLLNCFKGKLLEGQKRNESVRVAKMETIDWTVLKLFWDLEPTWQNAEHTLVSLGEKIDFYGALLKEELVGYVVFNPMERRIHQLAVAPKYRKQGVASGLLQDIAEKEKELVSFINIDTRIEIEGVLEEFGLENFAQQLEMELLLTD
ncbi:GNAT family N-acetyltransferase [Flavobacterium sp.]|uniref:GNAT family N-acetyltransferase n=1 Tax=Flavobacterium sp. TaxID=239 RepID=UPI003D0F650C